MVGEDIHIFHSEFTVDDANSHITIVYCKRLVNHKDVAKVSLTGSVLGITSYWIGKPRISRILSFPISTARLPASLRVRSSSRSNFS